MPSNPLPIDAPDLLAQATWVRRLAQSLVRDSATAEDVLQDTFVAALESAPSEPGRLKPWLARVATNFARQAKRREANRGLREAVRARSDREPSASDTAERLEAQRLLVEALEGIPEPYRTTITLRYLDGLSAASIARRQGIPAGTVRWRLKQGMDELRKRLDARFDSSGKDARQAWCFALLPLLTRPPLAEIAAGITSAATQGVMAMNAMTKVGVAAALVLTASVGVWVAVDGSETPLEAASAVAAVPEGASPAGSGAAQTASVLVPDSAEERTAVAPTPARKPSAKVAEAPRSETTVDARIVDRAGNPVEGASLALASYPERRYPATAADGRISIEIDLPRDSLSSNFEVACAGFATHFGSLTLHRDATTYLGDVTLDPGGSVSGHVLTPEGRPAAGADVLVTSPEAPGNLEEALTIGPSSRFRAPGGRTGKDGKFQIDGVPAGFARIWCGGESWRWSFSPPVDVPVGSLHEGIELHLVPLEKEDTIEGVVLSPGGDPVDEADVRYTGRGANGTWSGSFTTDRKGRFRHRVPVRGLHDILARDPRGRWPDAVALGVEPGRHDVTLRFPPPRWIDFTVRGVGSEPIEEFAASVLSVDRSRTLTPGKVETHAEGRARALVPGEPFLVEIRARGHGSAVLGPWKPDDAPAATSCTLERRPGVRGRVTSVGKPVAGARVALYEMSAPGTRIESNGFLTLLHPQPEDEAVADAEGYFDLDPNRPGREEGYRFYQRDQDKPATFAILGDIDGFAATEVSPLEIDPIVGMDGIAVELGRGGAIEGRVRTAPGKEPAGVVVAVDRGDGRPRTQRVGPDGTFRFDRLTPGRWNVVRAEAEIREGSWSTSWTHGGDTATSVPWNCTVTEGRTTRFDLDVSDDRPCVLVARVTVNGLPAAEWTAVLEPKEGATAKSRPGGAVDAGGTLRIEAADPGGWTLELGPPAESHATTSFARGIELRRGDNALAVDLQVGTVRGRIAAAAADASIHFYAGSGGHENFACQGSVRPDAEGGFEFPFAMAGRARLSRMELQEGGGTSGPVAEILVDVVAGGTSDVALP